jgi:opacity protein-like surface antigen
MKKSFLLMSFLVLSLIIAPSAYCDKDLYASFHLGAGQPLDSDATVLNASDVDIEYDVGFAGTIAAGKRFGWYRLEGEFGHQVNNISDSSGDLTVFHLLFNAYFDFKIGGPVTPYVTGGLGLGGAEINDSTTNTDSGNDAVVAYQMGTGVVIDFTETLSMDIRLRYFSTSKMEFENLDLNFANMMGFVGIIKRF